MKKKYSNNKMHQTLKTSMYYGTVIISCCVRFMCISINFPFLNSVTPKNRSVYWPQTRKRAAKGQKPPLQKQLYYLRLLHSADKIDVVLPTAMVIFEINSETLAVVYVWTFHILSLHMALPGFLQLGRQKGPER